MEQGYNLQEHFYSVLCTLLSFTCHSLPKELKFVLLTDFLYLAWRSKRDADVINWNMLIGLFVVEQGKNSLTIR